MNTPALNTFACLLVKRITEQGAFLDLGEGKEIFAPKSKQRTPMHPGTKHIVYLFVDEHTGNTVASSKWNKFIETETIDLKEREEVQLLIGGQTDMGYKAIINNRYEGLLYGNEIFEPIETGDIKRGYIKRIREDHKIDLMLQLPGYEQIDNTKQQVLQHLKNHKGILSLGDKSSPEEIYAQLKISKKAFKKTIGGLFKERLIDISDHEIKLV